MPFAEWDIDGMKNKKIGKLSIRFIFMTMIVVYILAIVTTGIILFQIPNFYLRKQTNEYEQTQTSIQSILMEDSSTFSHQLEEISRNKSVEFVVYKTSDDEVVYATLPVTDINDLRNMLNENAVSKEETFEVVTTGGTYYVWLIQYYVSPQEMINTWVMTLVVIVAILFTLIVGVVLFVFYQAVNPLQRLNDNILKLSSYQLDKIGKNEKTSESSYDALSYELLTFSQDLQSRISKSEVVYTSLEKELQMNNEMSDYRTKLLAMTAHDLKTPLHTSQLQLEQALEIYDLSGTPELEAYVVNAHDKITDTIQDVNDLVKIAYQNDMNILKEEETFDVVQLMMQMQQSFAEKMGMKNLYVENDMDEQMIMHTNKTRLKQLIHNAFSNICAYASDGATVKISCYEENDDYYLKFYNDAKPLTQEQIDNAFKLFYRISDSDEGTGVGLFAIHDIVEENGGTVTFENKDDGVELVCKIPKKNK